MRLALIDAIGPFFQGDRRKRINWSKNLFPALPVEGPDRTARWRQIRQDSDRFARRVAALRFNAVTLDDLAHLADDSWHDAGIRDRIAVYREEFRPIFGIFRSHALQVFITADYLTSSAAVDRELVRAGNSPTEWFVRLLDRFFTDFPEVEGIVLRIGESDGHDVVDPLRSRLLLRNARQVRRFLQDILPVFEKHSRLLVFRTWTVGAHLIGDLIWHRGRLACALEGIRSPALVVSMKYGESDFFRFLPLNRHFHRIDLPKIVEFQARPEYEGAGEFPSFLGWEYEKYAGELREVSNLVGFSVWCQTGGWHAFRRLAFLDDDAIWIELNTSVLAGLMLQSRTVEGTVTEWFGRERAGSALELLRRSDDVVRKVLYIEEFARQKLFFRRVRIPPLLHVYWDCVFINDAVRRVIRHFVRDHEASLAAGEAAFLEFARMEELAVRLDLPVGDILFMRDTFNLVRLARRYFFLPWDPRIGEEILAAKKTYKERWPRTLRQRYRIRTSFEPLQVKGPTFRWLLRMLIRRKRGYRTVLDHLFTIRVLAWTWWLFRRKTRKALPKLARKTAMGVDALFR